MKTQFVLGFAMAALAACTTPHASRSGEAPPGAMVATTNRGHLVSVEPLETRDRARLQSIAADFPGDISVETGAALYRVRYWTTFKGSPVIASGLLSVPQGPGPLKGVVLYAHGTNMTRALSPSRPARADGDQETAVFAGNRYLVLLPDYIGLGDSILPQAYAIVQPQVDASTDLLRAARAWANSEKRDWNPSLFLMGFSQGGQTVAGLHRALEREPLEGYRLGGTVAVAGPHELRQLMVQKISEPAAFDPVNVGYVAFAVSAYAHYYDARLDQAMTPVHARRALDIFDGEKTMDQIVPQLPSDSRLLLQGDFLRAMLSNADNWFSRALDENETFAWVPRSPIRILFGRADVSVPEASARALYDYAKPRGGAVSLHDMGEVDHMTTAEMAYAPTLAWFDALTEGETAD